MSHFWRSATSSFPIAPGTSPRKAKSLRGVDADSFGWGRGYLLDSYHGPADFGAGAVEVAVSLPSLGLAWRDVTPNPLADTVELELVTPNRSQTLVAVYDVAGHKVVTLSPEASGQRILVRWNGRDHRGRLVAPGVYLVRAQLDDHTVMRQVVRMR